MAPSFKSKPILAADAKGRSEDTDAFGDDDPAFTVSTIGSHHKLILNKFCVVRPQFVLHTKDFEKQSDPLTYSDVNALRQTMQELGPGKYIGIFNCGAKAGSSIGHKHMQVFPTSDHVLFQDHLVSQHRADDSSTEIWRHPKVPYEHAILPITHSTSPDAIHKLYLELRQNMRLDQDYPHNVIMTSTSIAIIPRTQARIRCMAANAASMVGMVWVKTEDELNAWKEYGPMKVLAEVGLPRSIP